MHWLSWGGGGGGGGGGGAFVRAEFLCVPLLGLASGLRVKLASCKSALNPRMVCSTDRSGAVVPVLVLLFVALWFILRGDLLFVFPCVILFLCFSVLLVLRLPRLGKRELILVLFVRFVRFVIVWICRFPLPLGIWEGLRFVIVALPGLFSYLFFLLDKNNLSDLVCKYFCNTYSSTVRSLTLVMLNKLRCHAQF